MRKNLDVTGVSDRKGVFQFEICFAVLMKSNNFSTHEGPRIHGKSLFFSVKNVFIVRKDLIKMELRLYDSPLIV